MKFDLCSTIRAVRRLRDEARSDAHSQNLLGRVGGHGGWWELQGYASILDNCAKHLKRHERRVTKVYKERP